MTWTRVLGVLAIAGLTLVGYASWQNHKQALKRAHDELELAQRWPKHSSLAGCTLGDRSIVTTASLGGVSARIPCAVAGRQAVVNADGTYAQISLEFYYQPVKGLSGSDGLPEGRSKVITSLDVRVGDYRDLPARRAVPPRLETMFARGPVSIVRVGPIHTDYEIWAERPHDPAAPLVRVHCNRGPEDLKRLLIEPPEDLRSEGAWLCGVGFSLTDGVQGGANMTQSAAFVHDLPASADVLIAQLRDYGFRKED